MSIEIIPVVPESEEGYDVFIFAAGYESRSLHLLAKSGVKSKLRVAYIFDAADDLSVANREKITREIDCRTVEIGEDLQNIINDGLAKDNDAGIRIAVDISSMSRNMMADALSQLIDGSYFARCEITVLYSVAEFSPPASEPPDVVEFAPIPQFAGWTTSPEKPLIMILGLGYDTDHAIGVMEYLDPSATFAFFPEGIDKRFAQEVSIANEPLIEMLKDERLVPYPVMDPIATYWMLRSLINSVLDSARVVLVPMGPKIFVSLCLACQREFGEEVSVWRASGHSSSEVKDVAAAGPVFGYTIKRSSL